MRKILGVLAVVAVLATAQAAWAAYWDGGQSTSAWTDANNWSGNTAPGATTKIELGLGTAAATGSLLSGSVVMDGSLLPSYTTSGQLNLSIWRGTTFTLTLQNSANYTQTGGYLFIGGRSTNTLNQGDPSFVDKFGHGTMIIDHSTFALKSASAAEVAGSFANTSESAQGVGVLDIRNGSQFTIGNLATAGKAVTLEIGCSNYATLNGEDPTGTVRIRGNSTLTIDKTNTTSESAILIREGSQTAGNKAYGYLYLGDSSGPGTINMNAYATTNAAGNAYADIHAGANATNGAYKAVIAGYGTISVDAIGKWTAAYQYNGSIIADRNPANDVDGGAAGDKVLDLSGTPHLNFADRSTGNPDNLGLFARTHTALKFTAMPTPAATGAAATLRPLNDINSSNSGMGFINMYNLGVAHLNTAGTIQTTILFKDFGLATAEGDRTAQMSALIQSGVSSSDALTVYQIVSGGGLAFDTGKFTFNYDVKALSGSDPANLKIFYYNGANWSTMTTNTVATSSRTIASGAAEITPDMLDNSQAQKFFAIGFTRPVPAPEPATMALLVLGGIGVLARRRRN